MANKEKLNGWADVAMIDWNVHVGYYMGNSDYWIKDTCYAWGKYSTCGYFGR